MSDFWLGWTIAFAGIALYFIASTNWKALIGMEKDKLVGNYCAAQKSPPFKHEEDYLHHLESLIRDRLEASPATVHDLKDHLPNKYTRKAIVNAMKRARVCGRMRFDKPAGKWSAV